MSAVEMLKSYRRNADEMLFKEPTLYAKKQMPKTHAKNQMLKKCKHDLSSNQHTEKVMKYKKKTKEESEYVTVPKQFKTNESQNGMFLKPYSYYEYRGDNLQHSVVNNNENQSRNPRAVVLSTHARLRFNSSMNSLLGAFDFPTEKFVLYFLNSFLFLNPPSLAKTIFQPSNV